MGRPPTRRAGAVGACDWLYTAMMLSRSGFVDLGPAVEGEGSKALRRLTLLRMGSMGIQRPSVREKTSVQKTGGELRGSAGTTKDQ